MPTYFGLVGAPRTEPSSLIVLKRSDIRILAPAQKQTLRVCLEEECLEDHGALRVPFKSTVGFENRVIVYGPLIEALNP